MKRLLRILMCLAAVALVGASDGVEVPLADSPALGPVDAPVTMIEFLDFQ